MIESFINTLNGLVWGAPMLILISAVGLYLTIGLRGYPLRNIGPAFKSLWQSRNTDESEHPNKKSEGDISGFNALMTSLAATIGTGNIAGVATAITLGGPGALFWMWMIAILGMATKYAEAVCAVHYREKDANGEFVGGPMYYIKNGLGPKWAWLGATFAFFGMLAAFGIGNTVQANSVAAALEHSFNINNKVTGVVLAILVGLVLLGGVKRIASVAGKLVPFMAMSYLIAGMTVLILFIDKIPAAFELIITSAFNPVAAGGFVGATMLAAIRFGVARGVFSNEAGLGSAPIAHAAAKTNSPVKQGSIAMLGTFIDTIILCSITGLVIIVTDAWTFGTTGAALSTQAFDEALPGIGGWIVSLSLPIFAFTTLLGWSYYGEKCTAYLFGVKSNMIFRVFWVIAAFIGAAATEHLALVWLIADTLNALMAIPNLIALLLLSPVIFKLTKTYITEKK